ncbi:MAG: hypothetical protein AB8B47_15610 [Roseobacter sp.]
MKPLVALALLASPAAAWEFTPGLPCLLTHTEAGAKIELTYDPTQPLYSVTVERTAPWPGAPIFAMQFEGPSGLTISTDRHTIRRDGRAVRAADTGFGNVLNGLQFNDTVTAILGDTAVSFSLEGAAEPVAAFRLCQPQAGV